MCGNTKRLNFFFQFVKRFAITAEWDCKLSSLMATLMDVHNLGSLLDDWWEGDSDYYYWLS